MSESISNTIHEHPEYQAVVKENALLAGKLGELEKAFEEVKRTAEVYRKALFDHKSERIIRGASTTFQENLFVSDIEERPCVEAPKETEVKSHKRKVRKSYKDKDGNPTHFPPELPRRDEILEPENKGVCPNCNQESKQISVKVTEYLCEIPASYYIKRVSRPVCKCQCQLKNEPAASQPLPKSYLDTSFLAAMLTKKFAWHLPFYRQSQMLQALGISVDRDVMIRAANKLTPWLESIADKMLEQILANEVVQMDESPITVAMSNAGGKSKYNKNSYFWPVLAGKQIVFVYKGDRRHCRVGEILGDNFKGVLLSDGYQAYLEYCKVHPECSLALCWDHARRNFYKIKDEEPDLAPEALSHIAKLYQVESNIKKLLATGELTPEKIPKYRRKHSLPVLNAFKDWLEVVISSPQVLPKSHLLQACNYVLGHWRGLTLYLDHGIVPISNITVEQQIRNLKLGAKNWLFAASEAGAETVAVMNSLVCTCRMNNINFLDYITDVLSRLDSNSSRSLTPIKWAEEQAAKALPNQ